MGGAEGLVDPSQQVGGYVAYFAGQLLDAPPGTDDHVVCWRNYAFSVEIVAEQKAGSAERVTSKLLNEVFDQELSLMAMAKGLSHPPEAASMRLTIAQWRRHRRMMLADLDVPGVCPRTPEEFLGALASGEITYKSVTNQRA